VAACELSTMYHRMHVQKKPHDHVLTD